MSEEEVYRALPEYVVQVGAPATQNMAGAATISWEFHSAFRGEKLATEVADELATENEHVRVVRRKT